MTFVEILQYVALFLGWSLVVMLVTGTMLVAYEALRYDEDVEVRWGNLVVFCSLALFWLWVGGQFACG